ncbi:MAG: hypothetical protein RR376_27900, partial [Janthinobacterium sp.]
MAEILRDDSKAGTLSENRWPQLLRAYGERQPQATIWGLPKNQVNHRIYVTDANGIVVLDSNGVAVGQDYSRWNDVYLTLRGEYGARSSRSDADDPSSSVMHVGAPIRDNGQIIGVVTVAKPNSSLQPYVDRTERRLLGYGAGLIGLGLLLAGQLYPFAVYFGMEHFAPWQFGLLLGGLMFIAFWLQVEGLAHTSSNRNAFVT